MDMPASVEKAQTVRDFVRAMILRRYAYLRHDNPGPTTHFAEEPIWHEWWKTHRPMIAINALKRGTFGDKLPTWDQVAAAIDAGEITTLHPSGKEVTTPQFKAIEDW